MMQKVPMFEALTLGVGFALGYFSLKVYNSLSKESPEQKQKQSKTENLCRADYKKQEEENQAELKNFAYLQELLKDKSISFELEYIPNLPGTDNIILTKKCLKRFLEETADLFDPKEITSINETNRSARRQVINELDEKYETYFRFICTLDENIKYSLENAQKDFAVFLNLDFSRIMDSISYHIENEDTQSNDSFRMQVVEILSAIRENLTHYLPLYSQPINKNQLEEVINFQTEILKSEEEFLVNLVQKMGLETPDEEEALPVFLACYLEDRTWEKFRIEPEQLNLSLEEMDSGFQEKFDEFRQIRESVLKNIYSSSHSFIKNDE